MGQGKSTFTKSEIEEYEELTYLNKSEILRAYQKFHAIEPAKVEKNRDTARITIESIRAQTKELRLNPYGDRICHIFNTGGPEGLSFDDFLDMYSALNENAARNVKTTYAFKMYDFDDDGLINKDDIRQAIDRYFCKSFRPRV